MIVGSDELPFRIYKASANYCTSLEALTGISANDLKKCESELPTVPFFKQPVLGVLNIAANDTEENEDHIDAETVFESNEIYNTLSNSFLIFRETNNKSTFAFYLLGSC